MLGLNPRVCARTLTVHFLVAAPGTPNTRDHLERREEPHGPCQNPLRPTRKVWLADTMLFREGFQCEATPSEVFEQPTLQIIERSRQFK